MMVSDNFNFSVNPENQKNLLENSKKKFDVYFFYLGIRFGLVSKMAFFCQIVMVKH